MVASASCLVRESSSPRGGNPRVVQEPSVLVQGYNEGRIRFAESGIGFVVYPDSDSLASRIVWIHGCCRGSEAIVIRLRL